MNVTRVSVCCAILLLLVWAGPVSAQSVDSEPGYAAVPNSTSSGGYIPYNPVSINPYYRFRTDIGSGVGYNKGYQTGSVFLPFMIEPDRSLIFTDIRGIVTNDGKLAANLGVGARWYSPQLDRVFGGSAWYDHDETSYKQYSRYGISLESLGQYFDVRANAYLPTDRNQHFISSNLTGTAFFLGHNIGLGRARTTESALAGGDFEVGGGLPGIGDYGLRAYIGGYYFQGPGIDTTYGFSSRYEFLITQNLTAQIAVYEDHLFGTNVNGAITYLIPNGRPSRFLERQPVPQRLYSMVQRQYRTQVLHNIDGTPLLATRAGGRGGSGGAIGTPIVVAHVNNAAAAGGDGSNGRPFNTLPAVTAANVDLIYVNTGTGTSQNLDGGITLLDHQRLLGEGTAHTFLSQQGTFTLPGNNLGLNNPIITNTAGDAVTLANDNEVSGFTIGNTTANGGGALGNGIIGVNITDFNINNVVVQNSQLDGISLTNAGGIGNIADTTVNGNGSRGIFINNTNTAQLDLALTTVSAINSGLAGVNIGANNSTINVTSTGLGANFNDTGLALSATNNGFLDFESTGDTFNFNTNPTVSTIGNGINLVGDNAQITLNLTNDIINMNAGNGIAGSFTNNAVFNTIIDNTTDSNNINGAGFNLAMANNSTVNMTLRNNSTFNNNGKFGVGLNLANTSSAVVLLDTVSVSNNLLPTLSAAGGILGSGFFLTADNSNADVTFTNDRINSNGSNGITLIGTTGSTLTANISNNTSIATIPPDTNPIGISRNGGDGILMSLNQSTGTATISNNLINANSGAAIRFLNTSGTLNASTVTGNMITNNGSFGLLSFNNSGVSNLTIGGPAAIDGNTFTGNHDAGIDIKIQGAPAVASNIDIENNIIGGTLFGTSANPAANGQGILFDLQNTGIVNATVATNTIFGNVGGGIAINQTDDSVLTASITGNIVGRDTTGTVSGNGFDGISFIRRVDGQANVTIDSNVVTASANNGISLLANGGGLAPVVVNVNNNLVTQNGNNGIAVRTEASAVLTANLHQNTITQQVTGDGINATSLGVGIYAPPLVRGFILGTWDLNTVTNNAGNGIFFDANSFVTIDTNTIAANGLDGYRDHQNGGQTINVLQNNQITNNGGVGVGVDLSGSITQTAGISGAASTSTFTGTSIGNVNLTMNNNNISFNQGGGVDLLANMDNLVGSVVTDLTVSSDHNTIGNNGGRGINLMNEGESTTSLRITNTTVQSNHLEGVYVMTNPGSSATPFAIGANTGFGQLGVTNNVLLVMNQDHILGNGSSDGAGGLVIAVGTSSFGSVRADIENSEFRGNASIGTILASPTSIGSDVLFTSYVSQPIPANPSPPAPHDPLARLDLQFRNNSGDVLDVTHLDGLPTQTFYNDASTTKSPMATDIPPGPFVSNSRPRNAERLPGNTGYDGTGASTFRVESDALNPGINTFAIVPGAGFNTQVLLLPAGPDTNPYFYYWNQVPVGTLFP